MTSDAQHTRAHGGMMERVRRVRGERGWGGLMQAVGRRAAAAFVDAWRRVAQHRNHVFVHDGPVDEARGPAGLAVVRCTKLEALPVELGEVLRVRFGEGSYAADAWELERGAVLWLGLIDGQLAGASVSRRGEHFRRWFLPLRPHDFVIFRNRTLPEFRGRGLCPAIMRHVIRTERTGDAKAYIDCRVFNHASIRSIEKTGFRRIATLRPISRKQALGK